MEQRLFGKTGMQVSLFGFGESGIGYDHTPADTVDALPNMAFDAGSNVIDTTECYDTSEELIGKTSPTGGTSITCLRKADTRTASTFRPGTLDSSRPASSAVCAVCAVCARISCTSCSYIAAPSTPSKKASRRCPRP